MDSRVITVRQTQIIPAKTVFRLSYTELLEFMRKGGCQLPVEGNFSLSFSPTSEELTITHEEVI